MAYTLRPTAARRERAEFKRVLTECSAQPYELGHLNLLHDDEAAFIQRDVARLFYEPYLPRAGERERQMIARLEKLAVEKDWEGSARAFVMASKFKELLPETLFDKDGRPIPGRYYIRHALTPKTDKEGFKWAKDLLVAARAAKQCEKKWFAEQVLQGMPESVGNLKLECVFQLRNSEGIAMTGLLQCHSSEAVSTLKVFMQAHRPSATREVASETNINVFWTDLITAVESDAIPLEFFRVKTTPHDHPPGATNQNAQGHYKQGRWTAYDLYFQPNAVLAHLQTFLTKQRQEVVLTRKDLQDQMSKEPYWTAGRHDMRFSGPVTNKAWGIKADYHPLGYQAVRDQRYAEYLRNPEKGDPRKGALYAIIDRVIEFRSGKGHSKE